VNRKRGKKVTEGKKEIHLGKKLKSKKRRANRTNVKDKSYITSFLILNH
jgi:hypothetical protein